MTATACLLVLGLAACWQAALALPSPCCDVPTTPIKVKQGMWFSDVNGKNRTFAVDLYVPLQKNGSPVRHVPMLVTFGHGFIIGTLDYGYLVKALVSHGIAVALPINLNSNFGHDLGDGLLRSATVLKGGLPFPYNGTTVGTLGVGGHSMGGGAATLAIGRDVSLFAAYFSLAMQDTIPRRKWMCHKCVSALGAAEKIMRPAMILAGSMDVVAPPSEEARRFYDAIPSSKHKYQLLKDATHC
jgi:hypothetical protein